MVLGVKRCLYTIPVLLSSSQATTVPQFDHRTVLGITPPPSYPDLDEISGPFEIKVVARIDDVGRKWQRLFDFGTQLDTDEHHAVSLAVIDGRPGLRFQIHDGTEIKTLQVEDIVDEEVVTTWTVGVDATLNMYIKKNGASVGSEPNGTLPADVPRPLKYIGKSLSAQDDDLLGAVLGMHFVKGGTSNSSLPMEWMNFPGQPNGGGFVASGYARFNHVVNRSWQRIFDFSDGSFGTLILFGQVGSTSTMRLRIIKNPIPDSDGTLDVDNAIVGQEMAFWEAGVTNDGLAWIRKNGVVLDQKPNFTIPGAVFRHELRFGSSRFSSHDPLDGVVIGFRLDKQLAS